MPGFEFVPESTGYVLAHWKPAAALATLALAAMPATPGGGNVFGLIVFVSPLGRASIVGGRVTVLRYRNQCPFCGIQHTLVGEGRHRQRLDRADGPGTGDSCLPLTRSTTRYSREGGSRLEGYPMVESTAARVDPSNVEQLSAWDGDQGAYWAARADRFDEAVAGYSDQFFAAAAIDVAANVLDIGCGSGQATRDAARCATAGSAFGVDLSSHLIELARERAAREQVANATFHQADAQVHPFPDQCFDIAMSRHGAMFFGNATAAFTNIARAMRPSGRLALLTWQPLQRNEWISAFRAAFAAGRELTMPPPDAPGPFSLSDPDQVRELLMSAGLVDVRLQGLREPMYFGRDVDDACQFIAGQFAWMMDGLDAATRGHALDSLRASMADHQTDRGVLYDSPAWLIEARRT